MRDEVLSPGSYLSRTVAQVNHLHLCTPPVPLAGTRPAFTRSPWALAGIIFSQEGAQKSSLSLFLLVSSDLPLVLVLGLGDDDVRASVSTARHSRGAEVSGAAEIRTEVLVAEVPSVSEVAEGAGPCIRHLPF